uniref:Uncharacterized protein n=1 Tax=Kalanchoe fedtschenkoi TaxID=63787 RepID=A0A7N0R8J7_KALFE
MDKSKSRTDLLAAGRKKLQQFRQKKDGKGSGSSSSSSSHGKSSKKHGKVEKHDVNADSVSSDDRRSESSHFTGDEAGQQHGNSSLTKVDSSVSLSMDDVTPETDANESDRSSVILGHETDVDDVACKSELPVNEADLGRLNSSATTEVLISELDSVQSSQLPTADSGGQVTDAKALLHEHDHPNISLVGTRGDQLVDGSLPEKVEKYEVTEEPPGILDVDTVIPDIQVKATEAVVNGFVPRGTSKTSSYELLHSNSSPSVLTPEEVIAGTTDNISQNVEVKDGHPIHEIFVQANEELLADEGNTLEFEHKNELPLEPFGMPDVDGSPDERVSTTLNDVEASNLTLPSASEMPPPELENYHPMNLLPVPVALIAETADSNSLDIETKGKLPQRNLPDLSLVQAREDQEPDYLGPERLASSNDIEVVEDKKHHEGASFSASIPVLGSGNNDIPVSVIDPPNLSVTTAEVSGHTRRDAITLNDGSAQMLSDVSDVGRLEGSQGDGTIQAVDIGISIDQDGSSRLLQLVNYLKELNEDEFRYLMKLRNSDVQAISGDTDISNEPNHGIADVLDAYKEQIYVANVSKDVFNVQLLEQSKLQFDMRQQLDDKVSKLEVSLKECNERNQTLDEELMLCRSELSTNMKNIEELSSAVQEWQDKFYRSQEDLSIVSKDLHDCRCLVDTIQMEKQKLSESLKSMLDESNQYVEEKENMLKENEKLLLELRDLKSQQAESASLTDNLNSVTEDKRKLDEERESLVQENTIILSELADCKNLFADVQAKHARASESIISLTEEKDRHDLQKHSFMLAYEKMTAEMTECKNHLAYLEADNLKLSANISSAAEEQKKLEEEKRHLLHELEVLSSENHAIQEALLLARAGIIDLEAEKNKVNLWSEQLIEESIFLHSCSEVLKSKIREISDKSREGLNESRHSITKIDASSSVVDKSISGIANTHLLHDGFSFAIMKGHMDTAEGAIHNLDKAIDALDTHHSYAKDDEASAKGISKLIQTFESKEFCMDHEEGETPSSVDEYAVSHLRLIKEQTHIVKAVLKQLCLDAENASELFMVGSENRVKAAAAFNGSDARYIAIQEHAVNLEGYSIELEVQNEALKENLRSILAKSCETVTLNEKLQNRQLTLESENNTHSKKLKGYYLRVTDMGNQLLEIKHHLGEMAPSIINQIKNMQMETAEEVSRFENHWNSAVTQIIGFLGRLDSFSTGLLISADPTVTRADLEIAKRVSSSVDSAVSFIQKVQDDFEALKSEYQSLDSLYKEVHGRYTNLLEENAASVDMLHKVHGSLRSLVIGSCSDVSGSGLYIEPDQLLDPSQISDYMMLIEQLSRALHEKMQLGSENAKLHSDLDNISKEMEEINRSSHDMHVIAELVEHVERKLKLATLETDCNIPLTSRLEKCISSLLQAHEEAGKKDVLLTEERELVEKEVSQRQETLQQLNLLNMEQENELQGLRWSLSRAAEELSGVHSELQKKVSELEQSEQRVSSIREKLSIAVAKGKGLIVQRDNLKQSLAEASSELEKSRQQLQLSESRLLEAETKLKTYAEAGERVEALESELSYIRNSATALRESFLLKDSVLQRIEEILEDLELPEHLHSREIIDKVDWLARSVVGNSNVLPATDWDQKSTPEGGSYSDNGFVVMDAWKDDAQHNSSSYDDLQRKHEELQNKFYGLAEQNEMLVQSLMERNNVVQRLEQVLDKINMPSHLRSIEAESRIEWLGCALSDAHQRSSTLQERIDHLETLCEKLTAELEESQRSFSDIKSVLEITIKDKEGLQRSLADITHNMDYVQETAATLELKNNKLQIEIDGLQEKLDKNKDYIGETENGIKRMLVLICTALQDPSLNESDSVGYDLLYLEEILRKLIDDHARLSVVNSTSRELDHSAVEKADSTPGESGEMTTSDHDGSVMNSLKKELEEALGNLTHVEEERDSYMEKYQSLCNEIEAVRKRSEELQLLLSQEEQKSASLREKLNVAVRKGKSLVQQRDSLKQTIEEMNIKVDSMTSEINHHRSTIAQYEDKCKDLSSYVEIVQASESENQMLRSQLNDTERYLHEERHTVSLMLNTLNDIKVNGGFNSNDPVEKLQQLGKAYGNLLASKASSDQESVKSKKAAELLLAELNEVQDRNDGLQDELSKVADEVSDLSKANKSLEAAKAEALSQLAKFSASQKEEQKKRNIQLVELKSGVDQLRKYFEDIILLLADVFSMDTEFFKSLELGLNASDGTYVYGGTLFKEHDDNQKAIFDSGIPSWEKLIASYSWLTCKTPEQFNGNAMDDICGYIEHQVRDCTSRINYVKEKLQSYQILKTQEAARVSTKLRSVQGEIASRIKSLENEREIEKGALLKNIALLYEACADSIREVGNKKAMMSRDNPSFMDIELNVGAAETEEGHFFSEEHIRALSVRLTTAVKDLSNIEDETGKADRMEMKNTIANLQKEIQEKDIQRERICMELAGQIKRAEAAATNYSRDLELATAQVHDLERQLNAIGKEKNLLEQKRKELEDEKTASVELQERVRSMTGMLSAKDQEIESLMQALDEEESEMEVMSKKIEQMEEELQQKSKELVKLEAAHNKALRKLSVTVSKFDELHDLSANLLAEVEKLQLQVQERDEEVSFLRQEVTRCTNDILLASQSKKNSDEIIELFEWLKTETSRVDLMGSSPKDMKLHDAHVYKESIQNQISYVISELEDLRHVAESRNEMLQAEKNKVRELIRRGESLETALRQKEAQLNLLEEAPASSENRGIEPLENNNWVIYGPSTSSQVRSLRKSNNDQVAIAVEDDPATSSKLEDEDEDKVHGFKSLTTSRIVPRFTRPVSDMVDGLWVSCDRALMRQPALRLAIILYWALLHSLLAAFVV